MKNKVYFSKELGQHFRFTEGGIIFEDKVTYTTEEIETIKKSDFDIKFIHKVKLKFDGEIISDDRLKKLTEDYQKEPSNFQKAVKFASDLMNDGKKGREAIYQASEKYFVSAQALGRELGKHRRK